MHRHIAIAAAGLALAFVAQSQTLTGVKVAPQPAAPGAPVTITADFDVSGGALNCNVRIDFGDGTPKRDFKINQTKDVPLVVSHTFAKAGTYRVMVEPKTNLPMLKCTGDNQYAQVTVAAPAKAAPAAAAAPAGPKCPDGWKLDAKSVNRKTGAFTCTAKAGSAAPAARPECPGELGYYENLKRGQLGCRP